MVSDLDGLRALLGTGPDFVVLAPTYPKTWSHGGEFIRTRVHAYVASGLKGVVIEYSLPAGSQPSLIRDTDTPIASIPPSRLPEVVSILAERTYPVLVHSPTPEVQDLIHAHLDGRRVAVWFHGYEVRDHRRLHGNSTIKEAALLKTQRDELNATRFAAAAKLMADPSLTVVFVSEYQRSVSELDVGVPALKSLVIPNFIDAEHYVGRVRRPEESSRILLMRSFNVRNYGNDIATRALEILSTRPGFSELQVTIRGFGPLFRKKVSPLSHLPNVVIQERYSSAAEMAMLHYDHGVFLCPSRFDTQGVMLGEAMASGMVAVTNPVAAIPEYSDESTTIYASPDDPLAFAEALWFVTRHPEVMEPISRAAMERVRRQCGRAATIDREIELIGALAA